VLQAPELKHANTVTHKDSSMAMFDQQALKELFRNHEVDIKTEKTPGHEVDLEEMFQEKLPAEAVDLREFLIDLKKNKTGKEFNLKEVQQKHFNNLARGKELEGESKPITQWLMAHETLNKRF
jgi:hypothetical protein